MMLAIEPFRKPRRALTGPIVGCTKNYGAPRRPTRERLTARRLFELLRAEGYAGAYDSVQRHVREWRRRHSQLGRVFIPLWFPPARLINSTKRPGCEWAMI